MYIVVYKTSEDKYFSNKGSHEWLGRSEGIAKSKKAQHIPREGKTKSIFDGSMPRTVLNLCTVHLGLGNRVLLISDGATSSKDGVARITMAK